MLSKVNGINELNSSNLQSVVSVDNEQVNAHKSAAPDPQVKATGTPKRKFTNAYRLKILTAYDACSNASERGALLRRESIYSSRITAWRNQLGLWEKRRAIVRHLSGGMKRRLMIARALVHQPQVLILDEPTAGVDIEIRRSMWDFLEQTNAEGTTIILTTHYLEEAEQLCKNVAIIDKGLILENTSMKELLQSLHHQTFVFNTMHPIDTLPALDPFTAIKLDANTFELRVDSQRSLNEVFTALNQHNIQINSMRNKTNRLEELFMDIINHDH